MEARRRIVRAVEAQTPQPGDPAWLDRLATILAQTAGMEASLLTPHLHGGVLALARDVAHGTERRNAPVAAFVAGRYVQARVAQGSTAEAALTEVTEAAARLLPPPATP